MMQSKIKQMLEDHEDRLKKLEESHLTGFDSYLNKIPINTRQEVKKDENEAQDVSHSGNPKQEGGKEINNEQMPRIVDKQPQAENSPHTGEEVVTGQPGLRQTSDVDNIPKKRGRKPKHEKTD